MILWILGAWFIVCVGIGIRIYFEEDHKFGTHNLLIAILGGVFYFFSPILVPMAWVHELVRDK
jgi:hypothetical protein